MTDQRVSPKTISVWTCEGCGRRLGDTPRGHVRLSTGKPCHSAMREDVYVLAGTRMLPRTDDRAYDLRQRLNHAIQWLREAEDIARIEMPAWPTADRIRDIYEQITEDVLNGKTTQPPLLQRLREAEQKHAQADDDNTNRAAKVARAQQAIEGEYLASRIGSLVVACAVVDALFGPEAE